MNKDSSLNKDYSAHANLISTTDPSSYITYANSEFCDVAGYEETHLLGKPHNLVRHKDMPKAAFAQMWQYLKSGNSWMGLVKNQCNDNQYYWVSAFVTPITDASGNVIEFQSVRSKPAPEQIARAEKLYQRLNEGKVSKTKRIPLHKLSLSATWLAFISSLIALFILPQTILAITSALLLLTLVSQTYQYHRFKQTQSIAEETYSNPLMEKVYTNYFDDYSQIDLAITMKKAQLRAVTGRATDTSSKILISAEDEFGTIQSMGQSLNQQCQETEQVATAVEELSHSIHEVATAASVASAMTDEANAESTKGLMSIQSTINEVNSLAAELSHSQNIINQLSKDTQKIDTILDVITTISEQTNLLALNAAIEAARAGEAGRGFAVVADEVRNLASKTGDSASEIHAMIRHLQETSEQAVTAMEQGIIRSDHCKVLADETGDVLNIISEKLDKVTASSHQIAVAVEEQASVTQEVNRNVSNIKALADDTASTSQGSIQRTSDLVARIEDLQRLMQQFSR
ncbi:PAS domain-containing protein [Vibrio sinensis]|uniref:PAS domain-containing protein n=1 Tax=Vibrio sinensis TaxID=2302434 RepID=A0A3A6QBV2_9VIBR|nr:PAS domain-containing methyl-accepting chemotaxis protein [Vibrio sinensis]RJX64741.1 PAS domain-containing protein [Vibrio sinensis]